MPDLDASRYDVPLEDPDRLMCPLCSEPTRVGQVRWHREDGGFWVPDALVDLHLPTIGPNVLAVFCVLCRCTTALEYPSVGKIARDLGWSTDRVRTAMSVLHARGLLNDFDLATIRGFIKPENDNGRNAREHTRCPDETAVGDEGAPEGPQTTIESDRPRSGVEPGAAGA